MQDAAHPDASAAAPWTRLSAVIGDRMGLHFPRERLSDLQRGVAAAAPELGFTDAESCAEWLISSPLQQSQLDVLAAHLTIGETYFFREKATLDALFRQILPDLIAARRGRSQRLRLWSAACCSGEEAYTLAILLQDILPDIAAWNVRILATDINAQFLRRAIAGTYRPWSFRATPSGFRERYFDRTDDGRYAIRPEFKRLVTFEHLNLVADNYPSLTTDTNAMDVILCRNALMYFTAEQIARVIPKLHGALIDGGWLAVSPSETSQTAFGQFATRMFPGAILYQKRDSSAPETSDQAPAPPASSIPATPAAVHRAGHTEPLPPTSAAADAAAHQAAIAATLYQQGRYAEAAERLLAAPAPGSLNGNAFSVLTRALANQGKLADALAWSERWIAADRLNASAHYVRAIVLLEQGQQDEARRSLQRAVYLDDGLVVAHFALGTLSRSRSAQKEADRHFTNTLRLLQRTEPNEVLPESDGLTAGRLTETVRTLTTSAPRS